MRKYILILFVSVALYQGCLCQKKNVGSAVLSGFSSDGSTNNVVGFGDDGGSGSQGNSDVLNGTNNIGGTGGNSIHICFINSQSEVYYFVKVFQISMLVDYSLIPD